MAKQHKTYQEIIKKESEESIFANPDQLTDEFKIWKDRFTEQELNAIEILKKGFALLSPRQKQVLQMRMRGLSLDEIAVKLWIKKGACQAHETRARNKLLKYYKEHENE